MAITCAVWLGNEQENSHEAYVWLHIKMENSSTKENKGRAGSNSPDGPYKVACVANLRLLFQHVRGKG